MTESEMLNQVLAQQNLSLLVAKQYIDQKADSEHLAIITEVEGMLNTTDLAAKMDLLMRINAVLDGDEATAGFQAWQNSVTQLQDFLARMTAAENNISTLEQGVADVNDALNTAITDLGDRITLEVSTAKTELNTVISGVAARVTTLEQARIADKAAQVLIDQTQASTLAGHTASIDSLSGSVTTEILERGAADAAATQRMDGIDTRVGAAETAILDSVTKQQIVSLYAQGYDAARSTFGVNADGTPYTG